MENAQRIIGLVLEVVALALAALAALQKEE